MDKYSVVGADSIRGYIQNSASFDKAQTLLLELSIPLTIPLVGSDFRLIPFYGVSSGKNNSINTSDNQINEFASVGLGINFNYQNLAMNLSYGQALKNKEQIKQGYLQSKGIQYKLQYSF